MTAVPNSRGLIYETRTAVGWCELENGLDMDASARLNESNELFLRALNTLEEVPPTHFESLEGTAELQLELRRLDTKLNLLMELVGHVLSRQLGLPPQADLRLGATGMTWCTLRQPPQPGAYLVADLYIQPRYPRPLELPGRVIAIRDGWVVFEFRGLSDAVQEGIQRLVFRHHRRDIATQRRPLSQA